MAVHHILESDLADQPFYSEFQLPEQTQYIIGHNVDYDITAIAKCGVDTSKIKPICTLALARRVWENAEAHNISALIYLISKGVIKLEKCSKVLIELMLTLF
jgi:exodeoxyribonuclease X